MSVKRKAQKKVKSVLTSKNWRTKLIQALRSRKYKKGYSTLAHTDGTFCCLGVLCDISGLGKWTRPKGGDIFYYQIGKTKEAIVLPKSLGEKLEIYKDLQNNLIELNDNNRTWGPVIKLLKSKKDL